MAGDLTIQQARLVLPDRAVVGDLVVRDGTIAAIGPRVSDVAGEVIDGRGMLLLPGVFDTHVAAEGFVDTSRAALAGGVTSVVVHPAVDEDPSDAEEAFEARLAEAERSSVHYGLLATASDALSLSVLDRAAGLVADAASESLAEVLGLSSTLVAVRARIPRRVKERLALYADERDPARHPVVYDVEGAVAAVREAIAVAARFGARLHLLDIASEEEVALLAEAPDRVTAEVCLPHLMLDAESGTAALGSAIVRDPPIRQRRHREALWEGLRTGAIDLVASGHRPVTVADKRRPYPATVAGMPGVSWLLPSLVDAALAERCTLHDVVRWLCEAPARTFGVARKGRLEVGFDADLVLVDPHEERTLTADPGLGWCPYEGRTLRGWPRLTVLLGRPVVRDEVVSDAARGRPLAFRRGDWTAHGAVRG